MSCLTLLLFLCAASCRPQDEIDKTEEMGKAVLEELEEKAQQEQEELLQKVVEVGGTTPPSRQGESVCGSRGQGGGFQTLPAGSSSAQSAHKESPSIAAPACHARRVHEESLRVAALVCCDKMFSGSLLRVCCVEGSAL